MLKNIVSFQEADTLICLIRELFEIAEYLVGLALTVIHVGKFWQAFKKP